MPEKWSLMPSIGVVVFLLLSQYISMVVNSEFLLHHFSLMCILYSFGTFLVIHVSGELLTVVIFKLQVSTILGFIVIIQFFVFVY